MKGVPEPAGWVLALGNASFILAVVAENRSRGSPAGVTNESATYGLSTGSQDGVAPGEYAGYCTASENHPLATPAGQIIAPVNDATSRGSLYRSVHFMPLSAANCQPASLTCSALRWLRGSVAGVLFCCMLAAAPAVGQPVDVPKTNPMKVYMHYMPWFETPQTLGGSNWGYHWKFNNRNPNIVDAKASGKSLRTIIPRSARTPRATPM